ncbi:entericidin, EcnA/B family [Salmonella enterica subsp. salamae]|nr:entericidin A/B family lipoprotein [Salmonella enterica subsp. salamae]ECI0415674.1 entericidin, EcnA/B family [Salmonella enterica subsp. salamae]EDW4023139.1 entericidin A/B family lipoprotein [Salmonella enterica subsp. salamae]
MMKRLISLAALVLLTGVLVTACNTVRGFGEDIQHLGHAISRTAS